jgi:hypothetical protein
VEENAPDDVYGLAEDPLPSPRTTPSFEDTLPKSTSTADEDKPLRRPGAYQPMSAAQKKKIAKRADKIDKSKPYRSNAAFGVSFGTVLAIALFGWRVHRTVTRVNRIAGDNEAVQSGRDMAREFAKAIVQGIDEAAAEEIAKPDTAEARQWLDADKFPNHAMAGMPADSARNLVAGFYEKGADKVFILSPANKGNNLVSSALAVQLPKDSAKRKACLGWQTEFQKLEEPAKDVGQKYILIPTEVTPDSEKESDGEEQAK